MVTLPACDGPSSNGRTPILPVWRCGFDSRRVNAGATICMIYINEWFPNPVGPDASGEFVELYNSGAAAAALDGYALGAGGKKTAKLAGDAVPPRGYLVLTHAQTKLSLKNASGALFLYGPDGQLVDGAKFSGAAPEGKSYSRQDYGTGPVAHFAFVWPTPGGANHLVDTTVAANGYPYGVALTNQESPVELAGLVLGVGAFFFLLFLHVIKKNRNVSYFLFGRNEEAR